MEKGGIHTRKRMCPAERENSNRTIGLKAQLETIIAVNEYAAHYIMHYLRFGLMPLSHLTKCFLLIMS